jgi:transaldolase
VRLFCDTASPADIEEWDAHPWVSGFTTNPTLFRQAGASDAWLHAKTLVGLTTKPISIDGPESVWALGEHVWRKVVTPVADARANFTAVCTTGQVERVRLASTAIVSVFAGRIMDTGRSPQPVIDLARRTGAQVLWASVREPFNIVQAEQAGCDIVTVPPTILRKWLDWNGKPLETVVAETIAQFAKDSEGLWTS